MNKYEYTLSFVEVLNNIFKDGGWFQGNDFKNGVYLKLDDMGNVHIYEFPENGFSQIDCGYLTIDNCVYNQKYRKVSTQPDIMRRV